MSSSENKLLLDITQKVWSTYGGEVWSTCSEENFAKSLCQWFNITDPYTTKGVTLLVQAGVVLGNGNVLNKNILFKAIIDSLPNLDDVLTDVNQKVNDARKQSINHVEQITTTCKSCKIKTRNMNCKASENMLNRVFSVSSTCTVCGSGKSTSAPSFL